MQKLIEKEFNLKDGLIYLNHAAVSPWPLRTAKAVQDFAEENMVQGALSYLTWLEVDKSLRLKLKKLLNAESADDIALLKNTSEALSVVAYGLDWEEGDNIVSSDQEFPSNRIVWDSLSQRGVEFREADLKSADTPEDALFSLVDNHTRLITISSVQFTTGLRMNLARIGEFCKDRRILFCVDAIQSVGALQFDVRKIQAHFVMADGHKWMLGPEGIAVFYCHSDLRDHLQLNQYGWHMVEAVGDFDRKDWTIAKSARRYECGSPNMMGIHALNASLSLLLEIGIERIEREVLERSEYLFDKINSLAGLELITSMEPNHYAGIVNFYLRGADNALLYEYLTQNHVVCSLRGGGIRLSPHFYTPYDHLDHLMELVSKYVACEI